jgi:quinol monooxygenase YgiN
MKITENIYWTITGKVKDGELENMKKAIQAMVVATRKENGAISYDFWLSEDDTTL